VHGRGGGPRRRRAGDAAAPAVQRRLARRTDAGATRAGAPPRDRLHRCERRGRDGDTERGRGNAARRDRGRGGRLPRQTRAPPPNPLCGDQLLDGERIRQQRLARDFVARFRELEGRRGSALAWREWIEFVVELSRWEVRLAASNEPGLSEALHSLQTSLRKDFAGYVARQYPRWLAHPQGD